MRETLERRAAISSSRDAGPCEVRLGTRGLALAPRGGELGRVLLAHHLLRLLGGGELIAARLELGRQLALALQRHRLRRLESRLTRQQPAAHVLGVLLHAAHDALSGETLSHAALLARLEARAEPLPLLAGRAAAGMDALAAGAPGGGSGSSSQENFLPTGTPSSLEGVTDDEVSAEFPAFFWRTG